MALGYYKGWLLLCALPLLLLAVAPLFPLGSDLRGFGPRFAVGLIACGVSFILGLAGTASLFFARRLRIPKTWLVIITCVASAPFLYLVVSVILGKA